MENFSAGLKKPYIYWSLILLSMFFRYFYYGFKYFPVVDDNNMYGVYSLTSPLNALLRYRMYTARPFAALLDTYVISRLWGRLQIILALMILLHFATEFLLYRVFKKNDMKIGILLILFFALNPLGTDATYWIAAASRIVAGMFFVALSLYLIMLLCDARQGSRLKTVLIAAGYFLSSLLSYGFYEQVTAFGFVFSVLLILANLRKSSRLAMLGITIINGALFALYFYHFKDMGTVGDRGHLVDGELWEHTRLVTDKYLNLVSHDFLSMMKHGIVNGFNTIAGDNNWLYLLAVLLISAAAAVIYAGEDFTESRKKVVKRLLTGVCLVVVSYAPFYVLNVIWISNRNTFISYIGFGLMLEALIGLAFRGIKGAWPQYIKGFLFGAAIFAFMLVNVAEVRDFKQVSEIDRKIVNNLTEQYAAVGVVKKPEGIYVFNTKSLYVYTTGRHLSNCTGVEWAFTGAAGAISRGRLDCKKVLPLKDGVRTVVDMKMLGSSPLFGVYEDFRVCRLGMAEKSGMRRTLVTENGEKFGEIEFGPEDTAVFTRSEGGG